MLVANRLGWMSKHPPERVVERAAEATETPATHGEVELAASLAHIGFGAAGGAAFGVAASRFALPDGAAVPWALGIWLVSYFGWIPALGILPPPTDDRPGRAWTMLGAHVVYGVALGAAWRAVSRRVS